MADVETRVGGVAVLALLLIQTAGSAFAAQAPGPPAPTVDGARLPARPGERLTFAVASYLPGLNGDWVVSGIFVEHGTLRMNDPLITAEATVACDTPPGVYPVERTGPGGPGEGSKGADWVTVEVADINEAERKACPAKVAALPPVDQEEHWPAGVDGWPRSPWDVATFRPGERGTVGYSDGEPRFGEPLTSRGFVSRPVMRGSKGLKGTVTIRCDAEPGLYEVRWAGGGEVWARYRVTPIEDADRRSCQAAQTAESAFALAGGRAPWLIGAAIVLGLAGVWARALVRRRRATSR
ncbi:hypothetical protein ACFXD5_01570 [Streptomyces sp. NPDC059385]|uniref:hypothetical protein n=1 Tax=Streptomyces sp. NPDC059385 TaxID=3346817 RepID=UPI0036AA0924